MRLLLLMPLFFLALAAAGLYLYFSTPVEPSTFETYTYSTTTIKAIGGNGFKFFWLGLLSLLSGLAAFASALFLGTGRSVS